MAGRAASRAAASVTTGSGQVGARISLAEEPLLESPRPSCAAAINDVGSAFTNWSPWNSGEGRSRAASGLPPKAPK